MRPPTHERLDPELCGIPVTISEGRAEVEFVATARMRADDTDLVHGGFVFGLADHAAMLAVGAPTVVLAAAQMEFLAPVVVGDRVRAEAIVTESTGKRHLIDVVVRRDDTVHTVVMRSQMTAVVPTHHVLAGGRDARR